MTLLDYQTTTVAPLEEFVRLRHRAWLSRTYGVPLDEKAEAAFSRYRYTNIWRELDRNTRYLINTVQFNTPDMLERDVLNTLRFRMFNRIDTTEFLISHFGMYSAAFEDADVLHDVLKERSRQKYSNFTASHAVNFGLRNTCNSLQTDRLYETVHSVAQSIRDGDQQAAWKKVREIKGIGKFFGDMIIMDVTWVGGQHYDVETAFFPDYKRGAKIGLDYCNETGQGGIQKLLAKCQEAMAEEPMPRLKSTGEAIPFGHRELEHSVCEYSKYVRMCNAKSDMYWEVHLQRYKPGTYTDTVDVKPLPFNWDNPVGYAN